MHFLIISLKAFSILKINNKTKEKILKFAVKNENENTVSGLFGRLNILYLQTLSR